MNEATIFTEAIQWADTAERAAYLDGACGGTRPSAGRVELLLAAHEARDSFLDQPVGAATFAAAQEHGHRGRGEAGLVRTRSRWWRRRCGRPRARAACIGPYKLLEEIGEGGMGTVFMAEQAQPVRRRVALKIIKPGMDTRAGDRPLRGRAAGAGDDGPPQHRQGARRRHHRSGRPYFVMELVKGVPITEYCDERRLTPRERLELFVPVCQAVQHAHQKGIIHRDIKPSNVLVALVRRHARAQGDRLRRRQGHRPAADRADAVHRVRRGRRHARVHEPRAGRARTSSTSTRAATSIRWACCSTSCSPARRRSTASRLSEAALLEMLRIIREDEPPRPSTRLSTTRARRCRRSRPAAGPSRRS